MRKILLVFMVAAFAILTACTIGTRVRISSEDAETINKKLEELQNRFNIIKSGNRLVTATMLGDTVDGPCTLYHEFQSLQAIKFEYDRLEFPGKPSRISMVKSDDIKDMAQKVTTAAYERMKKGKLLGCVKLTKESTNESLAFFNNITMLMGEYGRPVNSEEFDPVIIRAACLREIKPEVQQILIKIKNNENDDTLGFLSDYMEGAKAWHFTPEEIGVPKAMIDRLNNTTESRPARKG